jgi:hypothetical protein
LGIGEFGGCCDWYYSVFLFLRLIGDAGLVFDFFFCCVPISDKPHTIGSSLPFTGRMGESDRGYKLNPGIGIDLFAGSVAD